MKTDIQGTVSLLLDWFHQSGRELPWRKDTDPYHVWVSEIMLQQTRIETVLPYYARFMKALPDIEALSQCPQEKLLKLWEGLGYYSRVRNMQKAAAVITETYGGKFPERYEQIRTLPGIGDYTAGAIASIAFGEAVPAVDGNVLRVLTRLTGNESDVRKERAKKWAGELVRELIPKQEPGAFNQALMEFGEVICLPSPENRCDQCFLKSFCQAYACHKTDTIPYRSPANPKKTEEKTVLVIRDSVSYLFHRRSPKGLLAGMYELPNTDGFLSPQEAARKAEELSGRTPVRVEELPQARHLFSHVEWRMKGYLIIAENMKEPRKDDYFLSTAAAALEKLAVPGAFRAYMKYVR